MYDETLNVGLLPYNSFYGTSGKSFLLLTRQSEAYKKTSKNKNLNPYEYSSQLLKHVGHKISPKELFHMCETYSSTPNVKTNMVKQKMLLPSRLLETLNIYTHYLEHFKKSELLPSQSFLQQGSHNIYSLNYLAHLETIHGEREATKKAQPLNTLIKYFHINWGIPQHLFFLHQTSHGKTLKNIPHPINQYVYDLVGMHHKRLNHLLLKPNPTVQERKEVRYYMTGGVQKQTPLLADILKEAQHDAYLVEKKISHMIMNGEMFTIHETYNTLPSMWSYKLLF